MHALNRRATAVGAAALLLAGAAVASVPGSASAANILTNPGFESGLTGWSCSGGTGSVVSTPVHGGSKALAGAVSATDNAKCTQTVAVQPNTTYTLSSWVRGNYVYLGVTGAGSTWTPAASDWKQLSVTFTTGAAQTSAEVYLNGWFGQGTYYADDVSLDGPGGGPVTDTQPPTAPTALVATSTAATQVTLSWGASTDNVGVTAYDVYRGATLVGSTASTSYTDTGLTASTAYSYTVKARDAAGNVSPASAALVVTTQASGGGGTGSGCTAAYKVSNDWGAGFNADVTVTAGSSAISTWKVTWNFGGNQQITNLWNGQLAQSGQAVTVTNLAYNGTVAAGASTSFGFGANYSGTNALPTLTCTATS